MFPPIFKYRQLFLGTHFDPGLSQTMDFHALVIQYGFSRIEAIVSDIEEQVEDYLQEDQFIIKGLEMIKDSLISGEPFSGVPVLIGTDADGSPKLVWRKEGTFALPIVEKGLYFETLELKKELDLKARKEAFDNHSEMTTTFNYFKRTIPTGFLNDGCDMRCIWISFLFDVFFKINYEKIKVSHLNGHFFKVEYPFAKGEVNWKMHTTPVVFCDGNKYVFDISLDKPILLQDWLSCLHPNPLEMEVFTSQRWDIERGHSSGENKRITLKELLADLRGLYLFEKVDANLSEFEGKLRREMGWRSWVKGKRMIDMFKLFH